MEEPLALGGLQQIDAAVRGRRVLGQLGQHTAQTQGDVACVFLVQEVVLVLEGDLQVRLGQGDDG
ncbi:hypothetical protein ABZ626_37225, partial [Streptomyces longispororuber]|uniref:hypothetical protein n=1 Tax=Streptomyces longispororuber TaxID=68230 RepID=UPI00340A4142